MEYKYHCIEIPLMYLPDRPTLAGYVRTLNAAGCVAFCDPKAHTLSIEIPDSKWKHEEHIVEEEDI
jgi:hypothetical protein